MAHHTAECVSREHRMTMRPVEEWQSLMLNEPAQAAQPTSPETSNIAAFTAVCTARPDMAESQSGSPSSPRISAIMYLFLKR
eukprot:CAMPEP_0175821358 /NCGR_PEP_ID=MMETSP0107_2-20121207/9096_1 /TAXON_ID=195067 ORGANISM="Goniomonas pacifica, Strain CCMP1869" /NCGR_SAMPLE_ID=MMETSP0107_2 /ASSEMBLY_ACC=CAM_ASM_000203 /LENGTH=81 /DNA_ID=CAMNT_0017133739 /DNA_START=285 /DNA_END=526 /DNA_ORIENTATION=+